ncbi:MAG: peptidase C39 family protein, partial [Rubrobacter sp.]|nr:peptidase C39 family protein [Rubrobacter sp.]
MLTSPVHETPIRFDTLLPSWNAKTPAGTWLGLEVCVRYGGAWTEWFDMGIWASGTESVERHSVKSQESGGWRVSTDTVESIGPVFADAYRYRLTLFAEEWGVSPGVRGVCVTVSDSRRHGEDLGVPADVGSWGRELEAPGRSQMVYPDGGEAWCSPVSLSMVMAYWANKTGEGRLDQPVPTVVRGTCDAVYEGTGNWSF